MIAIIYPFFIAEATISHGFDFGDAEERWRRRRINGWNDSPWDASEMTLCSNRVRSRANSFDGYLRMVLSMILLYLATLSKCYSYFEPIAIKIISSEGKKF